VASIVGVNPIVQLLTSARNAGSLLRLEELALREASTR